MQRGLLTTVLVVAALPAAARGDGCIAPAGAVVKAARTPDQRALLRFDGTTETLVIETTVQGEGRDFAWILPLPAAPKIEASTSGLFPTLEVVTSPEVVDERYEFKTVGEHFAWAYALALGIGLWASIRWRRSLPRPVVLAIAPALLALTFWRIGLPGIPALKGGGGPAGAVTVLAHEQVGVFDTATLDAKDPAELRAWLDANGFRAPDGIDGVVADYLREGWIFVASKVHRDADDAEVRRIHPLAFTFPTKDAVYPMRLTGAANESLALDLFVVGDRRAESEGLVVEYCDSTGPWGDFWEGTPEIDRSWQVHEPGEFGKRCDEKKVLTKLSGVMDRRAMARDIAIRWTELSPQRILYVADEVARDRSLFPGACAFAAAMVVAAWIGSRRSGRLPLWTKFDTAAVVGALVVAGAAMFVSYQFEPRMPAGVTVSERRRWFSDEEMTPPFELRGDEAAIRAWMTKRMNGLTNAATGEPVREEDSPGNWGLREREGRLELVIERWPRAVRVLDVSRRVRFEGTIRSASGSAVAGASVVIEPLDPSYQGSWPAVRSEATGGYRIDLPVGKTWNLYVIPDSNPSLLVRDLSSSPPRPTPLDLTLPPERILRGRVVDLDGRPVAGLDVRVYPPAYQWEVSQLAKTSTDGSFQFGGIDAAARTVRIGWYPPGSRYTTTCFDVGPSAPPIEIVWEPR